MPPPWLKLVFRATPSNSPTANGTSTSSFPGIASQWQTPGDIFSILLIIGGEIIQRAIAQLSGGPFYITPVAFSFGWVAYSVGAVLSAIGNGKLMPETDCPSIVVNAANGYIRPNQSWILGRILRDWDAREGMEDDFKPALIVSICKASKTKSPGVPTLDIVWFSGAVVIIAQMVIASIPTILYGSWTVLVITFCGTILGLVQGGLPQWHAEKWACRNLAEETRFSKKGKRNDKTISLTRGNGTTHVLVVISEGTGFDLEDLASGREVDCRSTLPCTIVLACLWLALLLTAAGDKDKPWYLLLIGGLGMAQNLFAAGHRRKAGAFGIHLDQITTIKPLSMDRHETNKVFWVLKETEKQVPGVGISLLPVFFPGDSLRDYEVKWRDETIVANKATALREKEKINNQISSTDSMSKPEVVPDLKPPKHMSDLSLPG
jgi:hypothetical protein